ncbi:MAG: methyltransferase domain-containing protein [Gammaproteobacteria bacterium]|nr:methyltransferase domain-containing protein [Gammaproteobacteria bacterium]
MSDQKISDIDTIEAALQLDGDPQNVRDYYEDWAKNYNLDTRSAGYSGPAIAAKLLSGYLPDLGSRLLDAGCGTGQVGIELRALGYQNIDGFDLSESMSEQAAASGGYQRVLGGIDMMQAPRSYPLSDYDAVLSIGVFTLGHVPPEALRVLLRLARTGGIVVISTRSQYYQQSNFQWLVDDLVDNGRMVLLQVVKDAPYNQDGTGHYWVFRVC